MPFEILRHLIVRVVRSRREGDRHLNESGLLGGAPSLAPESDAMAAVCIGCTEHDGLQDAAPGDVLRQLVNGVRWELGARVVRILIEPVDRNRQGLTRRRGRGAEQYGLV